MNKLLSNQTDAWYTSRTLWIAFIIFVGNLAQANGINIPVLTEDSASMGMILTAIFAVMRFITKKPIAG